MESFKIGTLVKARGREWVVVPGLDESMVRVRPLGGVTDEECSICPELETIESALFPMPVPMLAGDCRSSSLLRNAIRLSMRSTTGPFRSFGRISVDPRPYQFVPLILALRKETIRLMIADDVGIGKTIEALLIARELLDRGEIKRFCVLSPAHLCDQWVMEMREKFHIDAVAVQPGTVPKLERQCGPGQSLFEVYPFTVVSIDYIKSDRRRHEFQVTSPELVIVDEAHTCAKAGVRRSAQQHRHRLLSSLAEDENRHLILVTATPDSGIEGAFHSLLSLLNPSLADLPTDLSGEINRKNREKLADFLVQRKRGDIVSFLDEKTPFPERDERRELGYNFSGEYRSLVEKVEDFVFETLKDIQTSESFKDKVRYWAALGLLRCVASSPATAVSALRNKAFGLDSNTEEEIDEYGRSTVLDGDPETDDVESNDFVPGVDTTDETENTDQRLKRRLNQLAKEAEALKSPDKDLKLKFAVEQIEELLKDGFNPIVYCRYIPTAEYVAEELSKRLKKVTVMAVTGNLHPEDRKQRVDDLGKEPKRVLVATDCLSEGINLQNYFSAVVHYDLSWNPTRHEQRDGRVDRFGQQSKVVRSVTIYGKDNKIDGAVLRVLLRKHKDIKKRLGVSVPIPKDTQSVMDAIFEAIFLRRGKDTQQMLFDELLRESENALHTDWENVAEREKRSQTYFAQEGLTKRMESAVYKELNEARLAAGTPADLCQFVHDSVRILGGVAVNGTPSRLILNLAEIPLAAKEATGSADEMLVSFEHPPYEGATLLRRTHPFIQGLAGYVSDRSLVADRDPVAARCGVMRTGIVATRTTLLLLRFRFHLVTSQRDNSSRRELLESCHLVAFESSVTSPKWIEDRQLAESLLAAIPTGNVNPAQAERYLDQIVEGFTSILPNIESFAENEGKRVLDSHQRIRAVLDRKGVHYQVTPELPVDVLGIYVYLPAEVTR